MIKEREAKIGNLILNIGFKNHALIQFATHIRSLQALCERTPNQTASFSVVGRLGLCQPTYKSIAFCAMKIPTQILESYWYDPIV